MVDGVYPAPTHEDVAARPAADQVVGSVASEAVVERRAEHLPESADPGEAGGGAGGEVDRHAAAVGRVVEAAVIGPGLEGLKAAEGDPINRSGPSAGDRPDEAATAAKERVRRAVDRAADDPRDVRHAACAGGRTRGEIHRDRQRRGGVVEDRGPGRAAGDRSGDRGVVHEYEAIGAGAADEVAEGRGDDPVEARRCRLRDDHAPVGIERESQILGEGGEVEDRRPLAIDGGDAEAVGVKKALGVGDRAGGGTRRRPQGTVAVGLRHAYRDHRGEIVVGHRVRGRGRLGDRLGRAIPLVLEQAEPVGVGERVGGREHVAHPRRRSPAARGAGVDDRHGAGEGIVDVDDASGRAAHRRRGAAAGVGLRCPDGNGRGDVVVAKHVARCSRGGDRRSVAEPLVSKCPDAVGIGERAPRGEPISFASGRGAAGRVRVVGDRERAGHRGVEVDNRGRRGAGDRLNRAEAVGHDGADADQGADVGGHEGVGRAGGSGDVGIATAPLEGGRSDAVRIGKRCRRGEDVAAPQRRCVARGAREVDERCRAGGRIVDIQNRVRARARRRFRRTAGVGLRGPEAEHSPHIGLRENVGCRCGRCRRAVSQPQPSDRADPVVVDERVAGAEDVALLGGGDVAVGTSGIEDRDPAGHRVVDVDHRAHAAGGVGRLGAAEAVHLRQADGDRRVDVGLGERVVGARRAGDRHAAPQPLDCDGADAVVVGQIPGNAERVPLPGGRGAATRARAVRHGDRADHRIVDVGDAAGGVARRVFHGAVGIGLAGKGADHLADVGLDERVGRPGRAGDRLTVAQPSDDHRAEAVRIGEVVRRDQPVALLRGEGAAVAARVIGDHDRAGHRIVDVHDGGRRRGDDLLGRCVTVGLSRGDGDPRVDVDLGQCVRRAGRTVDRHAIAEPSHGHGAETVVVGQVSGDGEGVPLAERHDAAVGVGEVCDRDGAGHGIVDVHDSIRRGARDKLGVAEAVDLRGPGADPLADVGLDEPVARSGRTLDRLASAEPLERHRPDSVDVVEEMAGRELVALTGLGGAPNGIGEVRDRDRSGHLVVDVDDRTGRRARDHPRAAGGVGRGGDDADRGADVRLAEVILRSGCPVDRHGVTEPLVSDGDDAVGIDERLPDAQGVTLPRRRHTAAGVADVGDRHLAGHRVVEVDNRPGCRARGGLGRAAAVGLRHPDADCGADVGREQNVRVEDGLRDRLTVPQPSIGERPQPVGIDECRHRQERIRLAGCRGAAIGARAILDRHRARHRVGAGGSVEGDGEGAG